MWALRVLNGPLAGQVFSLQPGKHRFGRGPACQFQIQAPGISKEHMEITVLADKIILTDLRSSNGTYLNGVRVQGGLLKMGDKISLHNILLDVVSIASRGPVPNASTAKGTPGAAQANLPAVHYPNQPAAMGMGSAHSVQSEAMPNFYDSGNYSSAGPAAAAPQFGNSVGRSWGKVEKYVEDVLLPGIYHLAHIFEFKHVIMGFVAIYIVMVALLSMIPLYTITSESITTESKRRAITVARSLAASNERSIRNNDIDGFSTETVIREEGIDDIYIVSKEGNILAPHERMGMQPREVSFVRAVKGRTREYVESLLDGRIAAAVPILVFDPELQQNSAKAHAIVVYNPGSLSFDDGRAFSLFMQVLSLALIAGGVLFFFLYKLIEYPFRNLNIELDAALRERRDNASVQFNFPVFQALTTNVNSLLARMASMKSDDAVIVGKGSRDQELTNLLKLIGYPTILISREGVISRLNPGFEALTQIPSDRLIGNKISDIPDPAMQQNFVHLMNQSTTNMNAINSDQLEIGGHLFQLNCQAIASASGDIEYFLITISPVDTGESGAA